MEWWVAGLGLIAVLLIFLLLGVPVAASLGLTSIIFLIVKAGWERALAGLGDEFFSFWTNWALLAIPLFVFLGNCLFAGGQAADLMDIASKWLRRLPGGLAVATIGAGALFATLCGSTIAGLATFGVIALPEMRKRGYSKRLACGAVCSAGGLAVLIPPSVLFVLWGIFFEESVGKLFMAGVIPGFILAGCLIVIAALWATVYPNSAPREPSSTWKERVFVLRKAIGPLVLVFAVLGTIYTGIATVTEAAALGAFVSLLLVIIARKMTWKIFRNTILDSLKTSSFILFIAVAGKFLSWVMTYYMIPQNVVRLLMTLHLTPLTVVIVFMLVYLFLGCFIDSVGMVVITAPFLLPLAHEMGLSLIWLGVLFVINCELAMITPPFAVALFIVHGVAKDISMSEIFKGAAVFGIADFLVMGLVIAFPQVALWLPSMMGGK